MRWTAKRKAEVLDALDRLPDQSAEIMQRHGLSAEELIDWRRAADRGGLAALTVKAIELRPGVVKRGAI